VHQKTDLLTDEEKEESLKNFKEKYNLEEDDFDEFDAFKEYLESDKVDMVVQQFPIISIIKYKKI
jgi:hypothetical protein